MMGISQKQPGTEMVERMGQTNILISYHIYKENEAHKFTYGFLHLEISNGPYVENSTSLELPFGILDHFLNYF